MGETLDTTAPISISELNNLIFTSHKLTPLHALLFFFCETINRTTNVIYLIVIMYGTVRCLDLL